MSQKMGGEELNVKDIEVDKNYLSSVLKNIEYNKLIINYYDKLYYELLDKGIEVKKIRNKAENMDLCNKIYILDRYDKQKIKDFKSTNLCHDKFCSNCKKVKQASRMGKFIPLIQPYKENLYHLVLTAPNIPGIQLKDTIKLYFKSFYNLVEYLKGHKKLKGYDFTKYGYKGCIRSLEVTYTDNMYHPHLHVGIVLEGLGDEIKDKINKYSLKFGEVKVKFSEFEILIQKIWYLLINKIKVNKKNIEKLEIGYSCSITKFNENDYAELFKYLTKETKEDKLIMTYENFKVLYYALYSVRQIQGYGVFYNIKDEDISDQVDLKYDELIEKLKEIELPVCSTESPESLYDDKVYTLISRKRVYQFLRNL